MKHVREDLPDVQAARPEVSARLAAVLDRMTEKDLALRHPDAAAVEADLEDALAAEASRTGTVDRRGDRGAAHAARRRAPPAPAAAADAHPGAAARADDRGGRRARVPRPRPGRRPRPARHRPRHEHAAARRADRLGQADVGDATTTRSATTRSTREEAPLAVDQDSATAWTTETYQNDTLTKPEGTEPGVGLYVDAEPSVNGRRLEIQTPEPGWKMEIYGVARERRPASGRATTGRSSAAGPSRAASRASSSTPATAATATTSSGSPRCRPTATRSRSRSSRAERAERRT